MTTTEMELLQLDRQFCTQSIHDKEFAWKAYFADDALMGTTGHQSYLSGWVNIEPGLHAVYQLEHLSFTWEPYYVFVSTDETLGVTTGMYTRTFLQAEKEVTQQGKYTTVWRKIDGEWRIVFDMGN